MQHCQVKLKPEKTCSKKHTGRKIKCLACGKIGHKPDECRSKSKLSCNFCNKKGHLESICFAKKKSQQCQQNTVSVSNDFTFVASTQSSNAKNFTGDLLVDCGATSHIINSKSCFTSFDDKFDPSNHYIALADGRHSNSLAELRGDAKIQMYDSQGNIQKVTLKDALYAPQFPISLFSVRAATDAGATVSFENNSAMLSSGETIFKIERRGNLYFLQTNTCTNDSACSTKSLSEWHRALGHMNYDDIKKLQSVTNGMKITKDSDDHNQNCTTCTKHKIARQPKSADIPVVKAQKPLERVHSDICGPINPTSQEGYKYIINFIDEYSSMIFVYFLRSKDEATNALKDFIADVSSIGKVKEMHTDNGGEYLSESFHNVLRNNRIKQTTTAPYSPYQNGKCERSWRSLMEMGRCLIEEASLPKNLWPYAIRHAQYLRNRSYQRRTQKTAYELFCLQKPDLRKLYTFGSQCTSFIESAKQKLYNRGQNGIYLGINCMSNGYYILTPSNRVITSRNVIITEHSTEVDSEHEEMPIQVPTPNDQSNIEPEINNVETELEEQTSRPKRENRRLPKSLDDYQMYLAENIDYAYSSSLRAIPQTYNEAISSADAIEWKKSMDTEVATLKDNNTYELVKLPPGREETKGKWVYTVKQGKNEDEIQYKARYVAKGYSQVAGVDYDKTYSPTARMTSIRLLLQKAANEKMEIHQMDVKGAYLNAPIDKDIYVEQPEGYTKYEDGQKLTCHLKKSLYGLKQSGRNWHSTLTEFLEQVGFRSSEKDHCVYVKADQDKPTYIIFWVDDIIIASSDSETIAHMKQLLSERFKMDDRGKLRWFLGVDFKYVNDCYIMSQTRYIDAILQRFGMSDCKPASTPIDPGSTLDSENTNEQTTSFPYRQAVGSLVYLAYLTRPDICWALSKLSQYFDKPSTIHVSSVKRVFRYLKGTRDYKLVFKPTIQPLIGYSDSDWAGDHSDRRSTSGYLFTFGSAPISWKSRKQPTVALSSCEAEYMALTEATKEALFLQSLCTSIGMTQGETLIRCDNQGAIALTRESPKQHQRTKHIDVRYHFLRSETRVCFDYVPTKDNLADIFTKPLHKVKHMDAVTMLRLRGCVEVNRIR